MGDRGGGGGGRGTWLGQGESALEELATDEAFDHVGALIALGGRRVGLRALEDEPAVGTDVESGGLGLYAGGATGWAARCRRTGARVAQVTGIARRRRVGLARR